MESRLLRRDSNTDNTGRIVTIIAIVVVVVLLTATVFSYAVLRRLRAKNKSPRYIPGNYLKRKWEQWQPVGKYKTVNAAERSESQNFATTNTEYNNGHEERAAQNAAAAGVDRNTSVRSVMTLPAYSPNPKETEQIIGREGERGGMDTVVEFPENAEEQEAAREEEMESLYQIRQARRREIAEREERRRERREARERGDWGRLEELRRDSRLRANASRNGSSGDISADMLIAEHQSRPKDRRVSSVAYASVGQVRHDGSRVRASSFEDERGGLLDGAAPMGERARNNSEATSLFTMSNLSRPTLPHSGRQRSDSGALSISTTTSSFDNNQATPMTTNEAADRSSSSDQQHTPDSNSSSANNRFTPENNDEGSEDRVDARIVSMIRDSDNDIAHPPQYDHHDWGDAPAYEERVRRAESQRQQQQQQQQAMSPVSPITPFQPLDVPMINVQLASEPNTPVLGRHSEDHGARR